MRTLIILIIFTTSSLVSFAQQYSLKITHSTERNIRQLPKEQQLFFDSILAQRQSVDWLSRIDSIPFDYAFIEEVFTYCDTTGSVLERYFVKDDTIPKYIFSNGKSLDPAEVYTNFFGWWTKNVTYQQTLHPKIEAFETYRQTQELAYEKRQIWSHGCVTGESGRDRFEKKRMEQLRATYQIVTMVDKVKKKVIVSVQTAPEHPAFEVYGYNGVWDW